MMKSRIDHYKEILHKLEKLGRIDDLHKLEDEIINEITSLIEQDSDLSRAKLLKLEKMLEEELGFTPKSHLLMVALKKSISGALSIAKVCLF